MTRVVSDEYFTINPLFLIFLDLQAVDGRAREPPHHDRRGPWQAGVGAQDPGREARRAQGHAQLRRLQGQAAQGIGTECLFSL